MECRRSSLQRCRERREFLGLSKYVGLKLTAGLHPIRVTYFDAGYHVNLQLQWEGPGVNHEDLKPEAFKHEGRPMQPSTAR